MKRDTPHKTHAHLPTEVASGVSVFIFLIRKSTAAQRTTAPQRSSGRGRKGGPGRWLASALQHGAASKAEVGGESGQAGAGAGAPRVREARLGLGLLWPGRSDVRRAAPRPGPCASSMPHSSALGREARAATEADSPGVGWTRANRQRLPAGGAGWVWAWGWGCHALQWEEGCRSVAPRRALCDSGLLGRGWGGLGVPLPPRMARWAFTSTCAEGSQGCTGLLMPPAADLGSRLQALDTLAAPQQGQGGVPRGPGHL